jgi:hypothetical protein
MVTMGVMETGLFTFTTVTPFSVKMIKTTGSGFLHHTLNAV